jgi:hypothetical protein
MVSFESAKLVLGGLILIAAQMLCTGVCANAQGQAADSTPPAKESDAEAKPQTPDHVDAAGEPQDAGGDGENSLGVSLLKNLLNDQKAIWTSPAHLRFADGSWLFPLATVTGVLFASDQSFAKAIPHDSSKTSRYVSFSNYGLVSFVGLGGGFYVWGRITHNEHQRETGILAGEAAIDSAAVSNALEFSLGRARPTEDHAGAFFQNGTSFPSDHSAVAWSIASVIAHEYPGTLTKVLVYSLATAVSVSRVAGEQHFPSDALVGSAMGWFIGRQVYRAHHDPELGGNAVGDLAKYKNEEDRRDRQHMGSPFVPMDSWIYPALERLAAFGYVTSAMMGQKPWTRLECARLTEEAETAIEEGSKETPGAAGLVTQLQQEFAYELSLLDGGRNLTANVESVYARAVSISGPPLTDGYHFGQTISNDFGRPFERGFNGQAGGSVSASAGPLTVYVRAEYQHAPSAPGLTPSLRNFISTADFVPLSDVPNGPVSATNRLEVLDAYAAVNMGNWELAVGRQTLSWGPTPAPMLWSDNIQPVSMIRLVNPEPFHLPGFLRYVGAIRLDQFFGRLDGHTYIPRPFIYGQKLNFKPLPFLEIGIGRTTFIGGTGGDPLTLGNFVRSFFNAAGQGPYISTNHGASQTEMDWTLNLPGLRNYVVFYGDSYAPDDILPIARPGRNAWDPGIYITRIPGIPRLDFHLQNVSTEAKGILAGEGGNAGIRYYWDHTYHDGYTNDGFLIGNPVGREGRSFQTWLTYWLSSQNTLQLTYKHNVVSTDFVPGGGDWQDYSLQDETYLRNDFYVKAAVQYENISRYPILFDGSQRNLSATLEVGYNPQRKARASASAP